LIGFGVADSFIKFDEYEKPLGQVFSYPFQGGIPIDPHACTFTSMFYSIGEFKYTDYIL
jgi:hypothetical protein